MDNRRFWNERYRTLPALGSGVASRGWAAVVKQEILGQVILANNVRTIIDIGCGDMCWYAEGMLKDIVYIGVDISDVIIRKNTQRFPDLTFLTQDISEDLPKDVEADLCICFDMLLHQCDERQFANALRNLLRLTSRHGLISYPTINEDDETVYRMDVTAEAQEADERLVQLLSQLDENRPRGQVRVYHDFLNRILELDPTVAVRALTNYRIHPLQQGRTHTVYELSHTGEWLKFCEGTTQASAVE
ncbi:MAG: class I SAM-dependent methyltransferase [Planctomycetota bacterium]|jgi:SAM-dependent methyltransferase